MADLSDIVRRCKGAVHLTANQHLSYYQDLPDYLAEQEHEYKHEIDADLRTRILAAGVVYELQFYPDTPVGFYKVFGATLDEVIGAAIEILDENNPEPRP